MDFLNYKDIGYIINDNNISGVFCCHIIYPNNNYKKEFCFYDNPMTEEQTMLDILPIWKQELESKENGYRSISFEDLYNSLYTKIDEKYYKNIYFYTKIQEFNAVKDYEKYRIWFCRTKKKAKILLNLIKINKINKIKKQIDEETPDA